MWSRTNIIYYIKLLGLYIGRIIVPHHKKAWLAGQVLMEYAIIAALVVGAIIGIQLYLQRALQGRYKAASDYALNVIKASQGIYGIYSHLQYDPYYGEYSDFTTQRDSKTIRDYLDGVSTKIETEQTLRDGISIELP